MSTPISLIIFCALAALSLTAVNFVNQREKRRQLQQRRLRQIRLRIQEQEELVLALEQLVENRTIPKLLNEDILESLTHLRQTHPEAHYLDANLQTALVRNDLLLDDGELTNLDRLKESDMQIAKSKRMLQEAATILRRQQAQGKISLEELNELVKSLNWSQLMVEVISHIGQGHKAIRRFDSLSAYAFYRKAQQLLMNSTNPDKRRHQFIKEVSEILNNKRRNISLDLMPESQFNPSSNNIQDNLAKLSDEDPRLAEQHTQKQEKEGLEQTAAY